MSRPGQRDIDCFEAGTIALANRDDLSGPGSIISPTWSSAIVADGRVRIELLETQAPADLGKLARQHLHHLRPLVNGRSRLRHPRSKYGCQTVLRFVDQVVVDFG